MSMDSGAVVLERLHQGRLLLPQEIDEELLARFFVLSEADKEEILRCRTADNKLGFALALSWFRMTGRFPTSYEVIPIRAVNELGRQMGLDPVLILDYPGREATKWEHEERIRAYLRLGRFDQEAERVLTVWVTERALEGDSDQELLPRAEDLLRRKNVELPGITVLDRLIRHSLTEAAEECVGRVLRRVDPAQGEALWKLLEKVPARGQRSALAKLKSLSLRASPAALGELVGRTLWLRQIGVDRLDLSEIRPSVVARLAQVVEDHTPSFLRRMGQERAVAYLTCFLGEVYGRTIDVILDTTDRLLLDIHGEARQDYLEWMQSQSEETQAAKTLLADVVGALLGAGKPIDPIWERELEKHSRSSMAQAVAACASTDASKRGIEEDLCRRFGYLRSFTPKLVGALEFDAVGDGQTLLPAIEVLRRLNAEKRKKLPLDAPIAWADARWRRKIVQPDGTLVWRAWETALWFAVQKALRAGLLNVRGSRRYRPLKEVVYGERAWEDRRAPSFREMDLPENPRQHIETVLSRFAQIGRELDEGFLENPAARFEKGRLVVTKDAAGVPPTELASYRSLIQDEMPLVDLDQILIQVARRVPYLRHLRPSTGQDSRTADHERRLLICLFGLGCNVDLARLARSTGVTRETLSDLVRRYFRVESLIDANADLVNYHHTLPLSQVWGTGEGSGADGQRREARGRSLLAGFLPRYFGHLGRGFTVYRHTSDQYSVFSTMAFSCLVRESVYMLDGLVANRTVLRPRRMSTDTHGSTAAVHWLSAFLGYDFCPRIAKLGRQRFFRPKGVGSFKNIEPLFQPAPVDLEIIVDQWDAMVRIAASVRDRLVPASVVLRQIENAPDRDPTARAIKTLGDIYRTMFLMRYLHHPGLRRDIRQQQNRCEAENDLSSFVNFGERGIYRSGDLNYVVDKVQCQSIVMNAAVVWNTETVEKVVAQLRKRGIAVPDEVLAHLSPLMRKHINLYGQYRFDVNAGTLE